MEPLRAHVCQTIKQHRTIAGVVVGHFRASAGGSEERTLLHEIDSGAVS